MSDHPNESEASSREPLEARITVLIPCYEDGALLREAVASVRESEPVYVIVVDDGSTDAETLDVLDRLAGEGTKVLRHHENRGPAIARNTALQAATTRYVFSLDSDDLAVSGALTAMADKLDADARATVCYGDYLEFGERQIVRAVPDRLDPFRLAYVNEYPVSLLARRSVLISMGGWRPSMRAYEDWDLWLMLAERGERCIHLGPGKLTHRKRFHGERALTRAKRRHRSLYRLLRELHPDIYGRLSDLRRASDLPLHRKLLYPLVYGSRQRFAFERGVKAWLDRRGVWTLRR